MNKTYAIVEVIEGEQIQLVRQRHNLACKTLIHDLVWIWRSFLLQDISNLKFRQMQQPPL